MLLQSPNALESYDGSLSVNNNNSKSVSSSSNAFSRFIKHYLTNRFGLKKLVEQQAWELIDGLHSLQHVRHWVTMHLSSLLIVRAHRYISC